MPVRRWETNIRVGASVVDKNGEPLGSVDHVARDGWSGEIRKFIVNRNPPDDDLFLSPEDVAEATETTVRLKAAVEKPDRPISSMDGRGDSQ